MESFSLALVSEHLLINPTEDSKTIAELKVGKAPRPIGVPNRALRNLSRKAVTFLTKVFNGVLKWEHYPAVWKHARVISLLKSGKIPALPSSYIPISVRLSPQQETVAYHDATYAL